MADKIGPRIELEGEKEFKKAVAEINTGLKVTGSELKMVTAQFANNAQSVEALTAKNNTLNKQYTEQTQKVKTLEAALNAAKEKYGDNNKVTLTWQERLNRANAELYTTKNSLDQNSSALQKAKEKTEEYSEKQEETTKKTRSAGDVIADMAGKLGIQLPAGADKAVKALDKTKISTMALVAVSVGLVKKFAETTIETAKAADEISTLSKTSGLATDTIQKMNYASELLDVSTETITGSMARMIRTVGDAQKGTGEASEAFRKLHVNIKGSNGQLKDSEQLFYDTVDALGKVRNETERDAIAMEIFGRSAQELNPLILAGSEELKKLGDEAERMGYVLGESSLDSLNDLKDSMDKFQNQTQAFKNSIAMVMLPILTALFETLNKLDPTVVAIVATIGGIAVVAISVVKAISNVTGIFRSFDVAAWRTTGIVLGIVAALIALAAIIGVITGRGKEMERTMASIGNVTSAMPEKLVPDMNPNSATMYRYVGYNATGTENWRGGLTWVGEEGPELIDLPARTRIFSNKRSMDMARNEEFPAGDTIIFQPGSVVIDAKNVKDFTAIVEMVKQARQRRRAGRVATV